MSEGEIVRYSDSALKKITLPSLSIGAHPVTVYEFQEYVRATSGTRGVYLHDYGAPEFPVVSISQQEANNFAIWVGGRIPTAEEWEAIAIANASTSYPWGDNLPDGLIAQNEIPPVGARPALKNSLGLQDLIGCVGEWTSSMMHGLCIVKGVPFNSRAAYLEDEAAYPSSAQLFNVGFRVVFDNSKSARISLEYL